MPGADYRDLVIAHQAAELADLRETLTGSRELTEARLDFMAWLLPELCKARKWSTADVVREWHRELDRRAEARRKVAA